jgi:hypothetical protein
VGNSLGPYPAGMRQSLDTCCWKFGPWLRCVDTDTISKIQRCLSGDVMDSDCPKVDMATVRDLRSRKRLRLIVGLISIIVAGDLDTVSF